MRAGGQSQHGTDPLRQISYGYDATDQLKSESASGGAANTNYSNAFSYDGMGNRTRWEKVSGGDTQVTRSTPNELNQLSSLSHSTNGSAPTTSGFGYDVAGNTTLIESADGGKMLFTYDDAERLVQVERKSAAGVPLGKSEFLYDYASRKAVSREFAWTNGAWNKDSEKRRVFDGLDVVQERNKDNEVTAQVVRDGNIGGILARSTVAGKTFFGYDGGGNVTLLTDENGDDVGRYRYDAFGNTLEVSGARAAENPYRFSTKEFHAQSGLYDYGYRFYSPGLGRWINRDPISEAGGINLYGMVGNNPTNKADRYGLVDDSFSATLREAMRNMAKDPEQSLEIFRNAIETNMVTGRAKTAVQAAASMAAAYQQMAQRGQAVIARINPSMFEEMAKRGSAVGAKFAQAMQNGPCNREFGVAGIKNLNPNLVKKGVEYTHELKITGPGMTDRLLGRSIEVGDRYIIEFEYYDVAGKATGHK